MYYCQKQPSRGALKKRCSENMQQMYRRTPMPKCDFNKVAKQLYWNRTSTWVCSPLNFLLIFRTLFLGTPLGGCFWNLYDQCYMNGMNWNESWNELKLLRGCSSFCQGCWIRGWLNCFQISSFYPFLKIFLSHYNVF